MEKPAIITIENGDGEVVYMRFFDKWRIDAYISLLEELNEDFVSIKTSDGEEFFSLPEYIERLLNS